MRQSWAKKLRAQPLTSKVTGGMRERRWGDSGPSCIKALTCGRKGTGLLWLLGGGGKAASFGTESKGAESLHAWASSELRGHRREAKRSHRTPKYLIFNRGEQTCQLAELGYHVDRIGLTGHLGNGEIGARSWVPATEGHRAGHVPSSVPFHAPTTPQALPLSPSAGEEIKDTGGRPEIIMARNKSAFLLPSEPRFAQRFSPHPLRCLNKTRGSASPPPPSTASRSGSASKTRPSHY